jgi:hypothetical protein
MEIPVFVSCPTILTEEQDHARLIIMRQLKRYKLTARALGRSDYPTELPLREVLVIARHCAGGIILGFEQFRSLDGVSKPGTSEERRVRSSTPFPTPWNNLEAGILFGLGLPLLIFREQGISGGIFDTGVTDVFIHPMPTSGASDGLGDVFLKWQASVRRQYYGE